MHAVLTPASGAQGIGPASASLVLTAWCSDVPFMSDEALSACGLDSKDYSMSAYRRFAEKMREKAEQLSKDYAKTGKLLDNAGWLLEVWSVDIQRWGVLMQATACVPGMWRWRCGLSASQNRPQQSPKRAQSVKGEDTVLCSALTQGKAFTLGDEQSNYFLRAPQCFAGYRLIEGHFKT